MSDHESGIPSGLEEWIGKSCGSDSIELKRVPGGASREAWFVDAKSDSGTRELFLRYDRRPPKPGSMFHSLQVEAEIVAELHRHGVTAPKVVAIHPDDQAVLMERVGGATWFRLISDADEQVRTAQDFIDKLAYLHRLDARTLTIPSLGPVRSVREHVADDLAVIAKRVQRHRNPSPLLTFCVDWLQRNIPDYDGPAVMVQGDTGPGNFMYENGEVTAIVDWELAHYGDPMEDIAWLSLRTVQDTFTDFPERLAEYEKLSGYQLDENRIWYYRLLAETRLASMNPGAVDHRAPLGTESLDAGNSLIYNMLHRRLLVEALAHLIGLAEPAVDLPGEETSSPEQSTYRATAAMLKKALDRSQDPLARQYIKGSARLVKYLAEVDRIGAEVDRREIEELAAVLGDTPSSVAVGRAELAERAAQRQLDDRDYVAQIWRGMKRDDYVIRHASGALRERTWPPLTKQGEQL